MPTYEYQCTQCDQRTEVDQRFTDDPLTICDVCGGALRKVFSAVGVVFKGSGFYKTDSRPAKSSPKESTKEAAKESTDTTKSPDSSSSTKESSSTPAAAPVAAAPAAATSSKE